LVAGPLLLLNASLSDGGGLSFVQHEYNPHVVASIEGDQPRSRIVYHALGRMPPGSTARLSGHSAIHAAFSKPDRERMRAPMLSRELWISLKVTRSFE
jgi:hypothetical protein